MPLRPVLRRKLLNVPFDVDQPYWTDDADFDIEFHVREIALPRPGSDAAARRPDQRDSTPARSTAAAVSERYLIPACPGTAPAVYRTTTTRVDGSPARDATGLTTSA